MLDNIPDTLTLKELQEVLQIGKIIDHAAGIHIPQGILMTQGEPVQMPGAPGGV